MMVLRGDDPGGGDDVEQRLQQWEARVEPRLGAGGAPALLSDPQDSARGRQDLRRHAVNVALSDHVPLNRTIREVRHALCRNVSYANGTLPRASVVVAHYREPLSLLLRTVHSVLRDARRHSGNHTSGYGPLHELLLVADGPEEDGEDWGLLQHYVRSRLPPLVRLLRLDTRRGVVGARMAGARAASGDVLVFLDAQCEVALDWLRPLLAHLWRHPRTVALPVIDIIDANTLEYHTLPDGYFSVGGFLFSGQFIWSEEERAQPRSPVEPVRSPTMVGGVFAMWRRYFWQLGGWDEGMALWGGENIEMSFRVWQCGGVIEVVPCSRVGHVMLAFHPHLPDERAEQALNVARAAEVWMDEYKELFYLHHPEHIGHMHPGLEARRALRQQLHCRSFQWYLDNIYPEKFVPIRDDIAYGRFSNELGVCLGVSAAGERLWGGGCRPPKLMHLSVRRQLRDELRCAAPDTDSDSGHTHDRSEVTFQVCNNRLDQEWQWLGSGQLLHMSSGRCLHVLPARAARLTRCRHVRPQQWWLQYGDHKVHEPRVPAQWRGLQLLQHKWRSAATVHPLHTQQTEQS